MSEPRSEPPVTRTAKALATALRDEADAHIFQGGVMTKLLREAADALDAQRKEIAQLTRDLRMAQHSTGTEGRP